MDIDMRLLTLDSILRDADFELAQVQRKILATYQRNRRGVIVLNLHDRAAILERARLRRITDLNYYQNSKLRAERRSLEKQKRARDKELKACQTQPF